MDANEESVFAAGGYIYGQEDQVMDTDLAEFLSPFSPLAAEMVTWPNVTLRLACHLTQNPQRFDRPKVE
ncbi:MAG: hypothetical protein OXT64_14910 [Gammaproteobacteria bacterium]|nr:hypothetical protein [Gammaproteobacteria bacterium]